MASVVGTIFTLLVVYQVKHFIADYPLQGTYMLGKFKPGWDFLGPLAAHCGVHAAMTYYIGITYLYFNPLQDPGLVGGTVLCLGLAIFDFICHFIMDRIKASPKYLGRYKALSGAEFMNLIKKVQFAQEGVEQAEQALADNEPNRDFWENNKKFHQQDVDTCHKAFKSNVYFWWALGLDQMVHHLTHYGIVYVIVLYMT